LQHALRLLRVVPQVRVGAALFEVGDFFAAGW
jgi:hypothetical protein